MRTKLNKKLIIGGVLSVGLAGAILFAFQTQEQEYSDITTQTEEIPDIPKARSSKSQIRHPRESGDPEVGSVNPLFDDNAVSEVVMESEDEGNSIRSLATLKINSNELEIIVEENTSVYDAMNLLAQQGKLNFVGKNYPGLGFFVTQIESLESGGGKNLMYDINGKEASVGISSYVLKEGDIIEWKLK